jgi:hypothetical protein
MADLDEFLNTMQSEARTVVRSPTSTVAPPTDGAIGRRALEVLKKLTFDANALVDEGPLGEGGMGIVHLAKQVALDRKVAIKFLRPNNRTRQDVEALLSEAWRAGGLEHPNILPIHALALDSEGLPVIVMKRIEGRTWQTLLRDPREMEAHAPGKNPLDEHLRILQQVCNAVHFAHTRGIVHRDLKPENVMVGSFGEVYVVDWGLACSPGPSLQLAGTPAYMAPEMTGRGAISVQTDVYLLGAVLYDVLSGRAPHRGSSPQELFSSVLKSTPELPGHAPETLAALVKRCMSADPAQRPASALEVRRELESFSERQGSLSLTQQSELRLKELQTLLAEEKPDAAHALSLFSTCRFGFEQALATWADNTRARKGLKAALRSMAAFEATHGSPKTARAYYAELHEIDAELEAHLAAAEARDADQHQKLARLSELETQLNPNTGAFSRMGLAVAVAVVWMIAPPLGGLLVPHYPKLEGLLSIPACLITIAIIWRRARAARNSTDETPLNRQLVHVLLFGQGFQVFFLLARYFLLGPWGPESPAVLSGYWTIIAGVAAASMIPSLWPTAVGFGISCLGGIMDPTHAYLWGSVGAVVMLVNSVHIIKTLRNQQAAATS